MSTELSPGQYHPEAGVLPLNPDEDVPPSSSVAKTTDFDFRHFFIEVYRSNVPSHITARLTGCLPYSLPLLWRLQFATNFEGIQEKMEWNRILIYVGFKPSRHLDGHFAAAYFDPMLRGQCWIYASFEQHVHHPSLDDEVTLPQVQKTQDQLKKTHKPYPSISATDQADAEDMLITVLRRMRHLETGYWATKALKGMQAVPTAFRPGCVTFGCMNENIRRVLLSRGVRVASNGYRVTLNEPGAKAPEGKECPWITNYVFWTDFCRDWNKGSDMLLMKGFRWDVARLEDIPLLKGKTHILRVGSLLGASLKKMEGRPLAKLMYVLPGVFLPAACFGTSYWLSLGSSFPRAWHGFDPTLGKVSPGKLWPWWMG
jgi:hypothetical protein